MNAIVPASAASEAPVSWLAFIGRAMADSATDVAKLEVLVRLRRDILADEAREAFNAALSAVQADMLPVARDAENKETHSQYARLETIDEAIRPIYTRNGFCLTFNSEPMDGPYIRMLCEVSHTGGHSKTYSLEAALDMAGPRGNANKTPLHALGSSVSYLRRYLTTMIFNVVLRNQDDDGNSAHSPKPRRSEGKRQEMPIRDRRFETPEPRRTWRTLLDNTRGMLDGCESTQDVAYIADLFAVRQALETAPDHIRAEFSNMLADAHERTHPDEMADA